MTELEKMRCRYRNNVPPPPAAPTVQPSAAHSTSKNTHSLPGRTPLSYYPRDRADLFRVNGRPAPLPGMYDGQTAFLLGNGPSMKSIDLSFFRQRGIFTFGVNNGPCLIRPSAVVLSDPAEKFHEAIWRDPSVLKFTPETNLTRPIALGNTSTPGPLVSTMPGVVSFKMTCLQEWNPKAWLDSAAVCWGIKAKMGGSRSVMLSAIHIAYLLGFHTLYLWGVDFTMSSETKYAFAQDRTAQSIKNNNELFANVNRYLTAAQPLLLSRGFKVYNCTEGSGLTAFPYRPIQEAIASAVIEEPNTEGCYERKWPKPAKPKQPA